MFLCYGFYVFIMAYNQTLMSFMARCAGESDETSDEDLIKMENLNDEIVNVLIIIDPNKYCTAKAFEQFQPLAREISGVKGITHDGEESTFYVEFNLKADVTRQIMVDLEDLARDAVKTTDNFEEMESKFKINCKRVKMKCNNSDPICHHGVADTDDEEGSHLCFAFRWLTAVAGYFSDGWAVVFRHIPDVNTEELEEELEEKPENQDLLDQIRRKEKGYQCTFFLSILWIGVICIFMVELAERIGCLIGIKSLFMGLTVLAAGTSIPDALGSIASAKRGMGDMAVANAIGSNVFDILIGLGLPWFLRGVIFGEAYMIVVEDLKIFIGILFSTIFITLAAFLVTRWRLGPMLGKILLAAYISFLFFAFVYVYVLD